MCSFLSVHVDFEYHQHNLLRFCPEKQFVALEDDFCTAFVIDLLLLYLFLIIHCVFLVICPSK